MWDKTYRPLRFTEVLGQEGSIKVLKTRVQNGSGLETSYLFSGGHGQGKTTLARILARALLCEQPQEGEPCNKCGNCQGILDGNSEAFVEQDAASKGTIENMRAIVDDLPFAVPGAPKRIYLFDEAHRMSKDAQDVLLKPLEESKMVGMFCTTEPEKIRGPIRSRCEDYSIRKVTREEVAARMKWVLEQEKVEYEEDAILTVVDYSSGHVRDILNRLEMIGQMGPVTVQSVREYLNLGVITIYYEILLALSDPSKSIPLVEQACDRVGADEVATGLAEAAMNTYRLAHGMYADFALADRRLGEQVYATYGDLVVHYADYFLQAYKPSKIGLICDIIRCAKGIPASGAGPAAPPVLLVSAPAASTPSPVQSASAPVTATPAPAKPAPVAAPTPTQAPAQANGAVAHANGTPEKFRADGIGSLGTSDPLALTDLDHKVVKERHPRGALRNSSDEKKTKGPENGQPIELLPANQWRHEFEQAWQGSHEAAPSGNGNGV